MGPHFLLNQVSTEGESEYSSALSMPNRRSVTDSAEVSGSDRNGSKESRAQGNVIFGGRSGRPPSLEAPTEILWFVPGVLRMRMQFLERLANSFARGLGPASVSFDCSSSLRIHQRVSLAQARSAAPFIPIRLNPRLKPGCR